MKKRFLSMLVLLAAVVSGVWAQTETLLTTIKATGTDSYSETTPGVVTVTHDNDEFFDEEYGWIWESKPGSVTVTAKEGYTITRCVFRQAYKNPVTVSTAPFGISFIETTDPLSPIDDTDFLYNGDWDIEMDGVSSIEVYGYAPAPPTYTVTLADGTEDADKWSISPNPAEEGATVTATYSGAKKVKSVKAKKKAAALIVNPVVGQVIGSDGKNYDANATLPDGVTALAKIAYVGSDNGEAAPYNHGLALALSDANDGSTYQWSTGFADVHGYRPTSSSFASESGLQYNATHNSDTYPAFKAAITYSPAAPTGCSAWFLASGYQWQKMAGPVGGLTNLGFQGWVYYWTSTEYNPGTSAWRFSTGTGDWFSDYKNNDSRVRACLAF